MTSPLPPQPPGRPVVPLIRPLRDLAAYALVGAPAIWLFVAVIRLIPSAVGQDFMTRVQNSFSSFVNVESIVLPTAAVLLATAVQPVHKQARLITIVALVEYAVAGFFAAVFGFLIALVNIATWSVRVAFEELLIRAAWLAVFAVAAYAVFLIWRNLYYTPKPKAPPGMYGQPQPPQWGGQPPYGQPGFPPAGPPPGYGQPQPGQPQPGQPQQGQPQPGQPQPGTWGQPVQAPPGQPFAAPAWGAPTGPQAVVQPASAPPAHPVSAQPAPGAPPGPFAPAPGYPPAPGAYGAPTYPGYGQPQPQAAQPPATQPPAAQPPAPGPGGFADPTQAIPRRDLADDRTQIVGEDPPPRQ